MEEQRASPCKSMDELRIMQIHLPADSFDFRISTSPAMEPSTPPADTEQAMRQPLLDPGQKEEQEEGTPPDKQPQAPDAESKAGIFRLLREARGEACVSPPPSLHFPLLSSLLMRMALPLTSPHRTSSPRHLCASSCVHAGPHHGHRLPPHLLARLPGLPQGLRRPHRRLPAGLQGRRPRHGEARNPQVRACEGSSSGKLSRAANQSQPSTLENPNKTPVPPDTPESGETKLTGS
jgi:hypothetical protein